MAAIFPLSLRTKHTAQFF